MQWQMNLEMLSQMRRTGKAFGKYTFRITMLDSTRKEFVSAIYTDTVLKKNYLLLKDKQSKKIDSNRLIKIYPSQTLYIYGTLIYEHNIGYEDPPVDHVFGKPADSCWMFKVKTGTISVYSYICEPWNDKYSPGTVIGIQLNEGPIEKYNEENLKEMIGKDVEAMKEFDKKKYFLAIEVYNKNIKKEAKK